jgi:type IV pilus assembly protein PilB
MRYVPRRRKLGEILVRKGTLTPEKLAECLREQRTSSRPLGQILIEKGIITTEELTKLLGEQLGIPHVWLRKGLIDPRIVRVLPKEKAVQYQVIPMFRVRNELTLGTTDPNAIFVFDEVRRLTGLEVLPVICRADDITEAINECYRENVSIDEVLASAEASEIDVVEAVQEKEASELAQLAEDSPVINLANTVLIRSIRDGASDIHIEPQAEKFRVRVRIDGVLYELMSGKPEMHPPLVSRLKVMAKLDIAERRLPQDGRIQVTLDGRSVDLRFSSMPGIFGEKVVLRILDRAKALLDLNALGFDPDLLARFKQLLRAPHGLVLVCGPTGSGKTTTLYSAIGMLNSPEKNVVTIEDPVEYQFPDVNQNQVREGIGLTFARFIKHALRQDPDIMLVGEIRDRETAETAIQAALTGHLVLSTLHTNDSAATVTRLLEMGIEPYLISSSLIASMSQRLVRTICPACRTSYLAPPAELRSLGLPEDRQLKLARGKGCSACYDSGFKGRTGIYELLEVDAGFQQMILSNPTIDTLHGYMATHGVKTLKDCGFEKVLAGQTTAEEVIRTTMIER